MNKSYLAASILSIMAASMNAAQANTIDFQDQPAGPSIFAAAGPAQTLVYHDGGVDITFTGGVILTNETNQTTNNMNVYATCDVNTCGGSSTLTNPLTVTFSQPLLNFSMVVENAFAGNYLLSDNAGNSSPFSLAVTGGSAATEGFSLTGTTVSIAELTSPRGQGPWDFAIGSISFTCGANLEGCQSSNVPEPATISLLGMGLTGVLLASRRRLGEAA